MKLSQNELKELTAELNSTFKNCCSALCGLPIVPNMGGDDPRFRIYTFGIQFKPEYSLERCKEIVSRMALQIAEHMDDHLLHGKKRETDIGPMLSKLSEFSNPELCIIGDEPFYVCLTQDCPIDGDGGSTTEWGIRECDKYVMFAFQGYLREAAHEAVPEVRS